MIKITTYIDNDPEENGIGKIAHDIDTTGLKQNEEVSAIASHIIKIAGEHPMSKVHWEVDNGTSTFNGAYIEQAGDDSPASLWDYIKLMLGGHGGSYTS